MPPDHLQLTLYLRFFAVQVKVWNLTNCKLKNNLVGHTGYVNTVTVSPGKEPSRST